MFRWGPAGRERDLSVLVPLQLLIQYTFFLLLKLYYRDFDAPLMLFAYGVTFLLQAIHWRFDTTRPFRILPTLLMCNSYLLFFTGPWRTMLWVIVLAWASRTFLLRDRRRHILNAGTFGIFWGAVLSTYVFKGSLTSVSHGLTTVPHLSPLVVLTGTAMAWLGGYLAIPLAMLSSFGLFRGSPNAAELIVFIIAAPDPATTPSRTWARWVFGGLTGGLTALSWRLFPMGNELLKVGGLVTGGIIMQLLRNVDWESRMRRRFGRYGEEAFWDQKKLRLIGVGLLVLYAISVDHNRPARSMEVNLTVADARTGQPLTAPLGLAAWPSQRFTMTAPDNTCTVQWEELFRGWDTRCRKEDWPVEPTTDNLSFRLRLGCRPNEEVDAAPYLRALRIEKAPIHRPGLADLRQFWVRLALDREALQSACPAR